MPLNIDNFKSYLSTTGVLQTNRFEMEINRIGVISSLFNDAGIDEENFKYSCISLTFPGRSFSTFERNISSGPVMNLPMDHSFEPITLNIREDGKGSMRIFFDGWHNAIQDMDGTYMFSYPDTYMTDINIYQFHNNGAKIYSANLYDVWPSVLGEYEQSHESDNNLVTFPVTLTYRKMTFNQE